MISLDFSVFGQQNCSQSNIWTLNRNNEYSFLVHERTIFNASYYMQRNEHNCLLRRLFGSLLWPFYCSRIYRMLFVTKKISTQTHHLLISVYDSIIPFRIGVLSLFFLSRSFQSFIYTYQIGPMVIWYGHIVPFYLIFGSLIK